jgi:hypothetical protein
VIDLKITHPGMERIAKKIEEGRMNPLDKTDIAIIRALANNGLRPSKAAFDAPVCRTTMWRRIDKIRERTGLDATDFYGCAKLLVLVDKLEKKRKRRNDRGNL